MNRPKVCLIYTGGTIAMRRDAAGVARPPEDAAGFLAAMPEVEREFDVDFVPLMNRDSVNVVPADWSAMARAVWERRRAGYTGFVVVHGTDTMHYSATALAFALGGSPLAAPVALTGAMRTADADRPDGPGNVRDACRVVTGNFGEVMIVFGGRILRGCQSEKVRAAGDGVASFEMPRRESLGRVLSGGQLSLGMNRVDRGRMLTDAEDPYEDGDRLNSEFAERVWPIALRPGVGPGMCVGWLEKGLDRGCAGVVLQGFGGGNVPNRAGVDWPAWIREATARDVPVVLASPLSGLGTRDCDYAPGRAAIEAGAIATGAMTWTCLQVKLQWAIARARRGRGEGKGGGGGVVAQVREIMDQVWVRETDEPGGAG